MLERLSTSHDGALQKSKAKGDRFQVFGSKKQVSFHVHISELRAELMASNRLVPGQPCVLQWVRGDTVHVTEESVGRTVLSWSDTYFAQLITVQITASGFRPKECKFKVQQKGKTVAKTATLDLSKYCSDHALPRDQAVSVPLQPGGTLYFVISTAAAASDLNQQQQQPHPQHSDASTLPTERVSSTALERPSGPVAAADLAPAATGVAAASTAATAAGGKHGAEGRASRGFASLFGGGTSTAAHGEGGQERASAPGPAKVTAAAVATGSAAATAAVARGAGAGAAVGPSGEDPARKSLSSHLVGDSQRRMCVSGGGAGVGGGSAFGVPSAAALAAAAGGKAASVADESEYTGGGIHGMFRRKARAGSKPGAAASSGNSPQKQPLPLLPHRKSDSERYVQAGANGGVLWDHQAERSLSQAVVGTVGTVQHSPSQRAIRSFSCSPGPAAAGPAAAAAANRTSPLQHLPLHPPASVHADGGGGGAGRNLGRASAAASTSSRSDTGLGGVGGAAGAAPKSGGGAGAADGGGGGGGWGSWLRGGLGWGRSSNHSVTATSTTGALSQASLAGPGEGAGGASACVPGEHESSRLEAAIQGATEPSELRDFALDLLRERDEWRRRALGAQDALNRAQMSRGAAVREAQRLEVRLKQYQDELGRSTDGTLLQELVEAKLQIAELANENMKLRRQITHMGPLFYDDSGDDAGPPGDL